MRTYNADRQQGFTLLEILVSLVILAVGLLGLAGLQSASVINNHGSLMRSEASLLSYDILERIRTNRDQALTTNRYLSDFGDSASSYSTCAATCTPPELASHDLNQWKSDIAAQLPGGEAEIARESLPVGAIYVVTVRWDEMIPDETDPKLRKKSTAQLQLRSEI
ncbi:MAG: type IV pilus modification protein PilV [Pseudomonadales bacterium]|nr:type IV pilus modification protein PilV [Pseudomonadales bacterium]